MPWNLRENPECTLRFFFGDQTAVADETASNADRDVDFQILLHNTSGRFNSLALDNRFCPDFGIVEGVQI